MKQFILFFKSNVEFFILFPLFLSVGFLGYYGSVDKVSVQWLYLPFVSILSIFYVDSKYKFNTLPFFKSPYIIAFIAVIFFGILSFFNSNNISETIIVLSRWIILFGVFYSLFSIFTYLKPTLYLLSLALSIVLLLELLYSLSTLLDILKIVNFNQDYAILLKGVTGNKNITSAIFAVKLPFVYYLLYNSKSLMLKIFSFILICLTFFTLYFLSTRGILLGLLICSLIIFFIFIISSIKFSFKIAFKNLLIFISPIFVSLFLFSISLGESNNTVNLSSRLSNSISPNNSSVSTRLGYYSNAIDQILETPIIGIGLGNWKIKSIDFDHLNIDGYTVPYNTHNDLLELGAEIGFPGLITYLFSFIYLFYLLSLFFKKNIISPIGIISIASALFLYFIDLNLNFPTYRPVSHLLLLIISSYLIHLKINIHEKHVD